MRRRFARDPQADAALHHSLRDAAAFAIMLGAGESYFSAFALHLGASATQIGLMASLPLLVGSLAQLFSAWAGRRLGCRRPLILAAVAAQILIWPLLIGLPLGFPAWGPWLLLGTVLLYHAAGNIVLPQWSSLMGDLVPEGRRGRYFALRTRISSITALIALAAAGLLLHLFEAQGAARLGFITIFATAVLARLGSLWQLTHMHEPGGKVAVLEQPRIRLWRELRGTPLLRFTLFYAAMNFSVMIAGPYFAIYMLRDLHFSYLEFMANTATATLVTFLTLGLWGRLGDSLGNRRIIVITGFLMPLVPLLWLVSDNFWFLLLAQVYSGFIWSGFNLSAANYLYDLVPPPRRVSLLALHNTCANLAMFCGALLGAWLGAVLPTRYPVGGSTIEWPSVLLLLFLISGVGRLAAALLLPALREVRVIKPLPAAWAFFRALPEEEEEAGGELEPGRPAATQKAG